MPWPLLMVALAPLEEYRDQIEMVEKEHAVQAGRRIILLGVLNIGTAIFAFLLALHVLRMTGYDALLMRLLATVRHLLTFSVRWG